MRRSPFSYLEIHTAQDFTVLGFTMEDPSQENNWVEFMIHDSGVIEIDQSISLAALPYILIDMSDMDDGDSDEEVVDYDQDGYSEDEDCDDSDWGTNPGAEESMMVWTTIAMDLSIMMMTVVLNAGRSFGTHLILISVIVHIRIHR